MESDFSYVCVHVRSLCPRVAKEGCSVVFRSSFYRRHPLFSAFFSPATSTSRNHSPCPLALLSSLSRSGASRRSSSRRVLFLHETNRPAVHRHQKRDNRSPMNLSIYVSISLCRLLCIDSPLDCLLLSSCLDEGKTFLPIQESIFLEQQSPPFLLSLLLSSAHFESLQPSFS